MNMLPLPLHRILSLGSLMAGCLALHAQNNNVGINTTGAAPDLKAILDVASDNATGLKKGMLIPRMTAAQRIALTPGAAQNGLTVYQTDAPAGFYYYSSAHAKWFRQTGSGNIWDIQGNELVNATSDFIGTTDNQPVVFRTNGVERMRFTGTQGYLGVGTTTPQEQLDVNGALRTWAQSPISGTAGTNARYSNTDNPGVVQYQKDYYMSTATAPDVSRALLFRGHWGNVGTSAGGPSSITSGSSSLAPTTGGWRRLENDYTEEFNKSYTQQGTVTCGAPNVEIPQGIPSGTTTNDPIISPYAHDGVRTRHQYMFRALELNAEANQLAGNSVTGGLCPGAPITSIAFYVGSGTGRAWGQSSITVKHAAAGLNDLASGFDNSVDPAQACANPTGVHPAGAGWETFTLSPAFVWDGTSNVIIEVVIAASATTPAASAPTVKFATCGFTCTVGKNSPTAAGCTTFGAAGSCGAATQGAGIPWSGGCGTAIPLTSRPVVRFGGTVASITPPVTGTGAYLRYYGALIAEATTDPIPWGRWRINVPAGTAIDSYRGPGTISAEKGIYDNGVRLNDHVFDRAFDGRVDADDIALFGDQRNLSIPEMADHTRLERHLPTMRGRESWEREGGFSLGDLTNQLWVTAETQALYVADLHDRLNVLELLTDDRPLSEEEVIQAKRSICAMSDLREQEKAAMVQHLAARAVTTHTQR